MEWISYLLFPLLISLAVTRSRWSNLAPLLALTVLAFIVHSRGTLDVTSGALAIGRGVSEFVLGLWLLPRVKAARQWPMMQRDLPLLIAFLLPFALMQFTMTPPLTLLLIGAYVLLIWLAAAQGDRQSPLLRLLDNRFTNWLGDLSYSIYLLHALVLLTGCELVHYLAPGLGAGAHRVVVRPDQPLAGRAGHPVDARRADRSLVPQLHPAGAAAATAPAPTRQGSPDGDGASRLSPHQRWPRWQHGSPSGQLRGEPCQRHGEGRALIFSPPIPCALCEFPFEPERPLVA